MGVQMGPNLAPPPEGRMVPTCRVDGGPALPYPPTPAGNYAYCYDMDHALMLRHKTEAALALTGFHDSVATSGGSDASLTLAGLLFDLTPEIKSLGQSAFAHLPSTLTKDLKSLSPFLNDGIASLLEHGEGIGATLDGVATVIDARIKTQELLDEGEEEGKAIWVPVVAAGAGTVAGIFVASAIGVLAGPELIVGGAAVLGGLVVGIGVNNLVTDFCDEHWDEDMHLYGPLWPVFGGAHVIGNTIADTAGNIGDILSPIGNLASPITNGVGDFMGGLGIHF